MEIALSPKEEKKISLIDGYENYLTLDCAKAEKGEGVVYKNQVLAVDFCVFERGEGFKKLLTRFDADGSVFGPGFFKVNFLGGRQSVVCSLLKNALYFKCEHFCAPDAELAILPSIDLAKKLDKGQALASSAKVEVLKPLASELLQLTKVFGKKAAHARILSFSEPCEIYISLEHSPSASTKAAARFLKEDAFAACQDEIKHALEKSAFKSGDPLYDSALEWAKFSSLQFLNKNRTKAFWAGLPWFRDYWGRDIFLSVPGSLLLSGNFLEAQRLFESFSAFQDTNPRSVTYGRLPNIYRGSGDAIYNTADASLLFTREVLETARFSGDTEFLEALWPSVRLALECDRSLRTDSSGFLLHGDSDTWMDARIFGEKAFCPRGNRANDIQALWFSALLCGAEIAAILGKESERRAWEEEAQKVKHAFLGTFFDGQKMADCILRDGAADFRARPNQLALVTVPKITGQKFIPKEVEAQITKNAVCALLFPYGMCSLSQDDPYFHPYHMTWEMHHEDAAYHNGAIWTWTAGLAIGALCESGFQDLAWKFAKNVASQFFDGPCAGTLGANLWAYPDADGKLRWSGAYSSCRSAAEFYKAAWEYFLGLQVDLLKNKISLSPRLPSEWKAGSAQIALGIKNSMLLEISWTEADQDQKRTFTFCLKKSGAEKSSGKLGEDSKSEKPAQTAAPPTAAVFFDGTEEAFELSGGEKKCAGKIFFAQNPPDFARPHCLDPDWKKPECLLQKNFLAEIALRQEFNPGHPSSLTAIRN